MATRGRGGIGVRAGVDSARRQRSYGAAYAFGVLAADAHRKGERLKYLGAALLLVVLGALSAGMLAEGRSDERLPANDVVRPMRDADESHLDKRGRADVAVPEMPTAPPLPSPVVTDAPTLAPTPLVVPKLPTEPTPGPEPVVLPPPEQPTPAIIEPGGYTGVRAQIAEVVCRPEFSWPCGEAVAVSYCEMGGIWQPDAVNDHVRGLMQIHDIHAARFPQYWDSWADPYANAQMAHVLYVEQGWGPWACKPW